jgi:hypothetical protein
LAAIVTRAERANTVLPAHMKTMDFALNAKTCLKVSVAELAKRPGMTLAQLVFVLATGTALTAAAATISVQVDKPGHKIAPTLWGIFFEDINLSADGGIYPELVRNRSFEDGEKPENWKLRSVNEGANEMAIDSSRPLNPLNRRSLRLRVGGPFQLENEGYWGMNVVKDAGYALKLAARATDGFTGPLRVRLISSSGTDLASAEIGAIGNSWDYHNADLHASEGDPKARLEISGSGKGTLFLDMVSLLPKQTWKNNGLRPDLAESLDALKPSFVRFPGGCWVEGEDMAHMYNWKKTIGNVDRRTPLWNIWGYNATHGLGFHEYLQLTEDLGATPLFCINVGMSHKEVVPMDQMGQWVQDALDAIEYANGPTNTSGAACARSMATQRLSSCAIWKSETKTARGATTNAGPSCIARSKANTPRCNSSRTYGRATCREIRSPT